MRETFDETNKTMHLELVKRAHCTQRYRQHCRSYEPRDLCNLNEKNSEIQTNK